MAEDIGCRVDFRNYKKQRGFSFYCLKLYTICCNVNLGDIGKKETIAHELAHIIFHKELLRKLSKNHEGLSQYSFFNMVDLTEIEANRFAAYLLANPEELLEYLMEGHTLTECSKNMGIHVPFLNILAKDMQKEGIIPAHFDLYVPPRFLKDLSIDIDDYFTHD